MKPRPRLTADNNPLQRRPSAPGTALPTPATTAGFSYSIPEDLRPQLQALQQRWQLSEAEIVEYALRFLLAQTQRRPIAPHLPTDNDHLMEFLD